MVDVSVNILCLAMCVFVSLDFGLNLKVFHLEDAIVNVGYSGVEVGFSGNMIEYPFVKCVLNLTDIVNGTEFKNYANELILEKTKVYDLSFVNGVEITHPDLYYNDWLVVHGRQCLIPIAYEIDDEMEEDPGKPEDINMFLSPSIIVILRHFVFFFPESPQTSYINPHAFGSGGSSHSSGSQGGEGTVDGEGVIECGRSRKFESGNNQIDNKKQYQLDLEKIKSGGDTRTTLMIKTIPNKYTSKMLLAAIDETHKSAYDFLYLPIDFKNKCNVDYAFINVVSPAHIVSFYDAFNGKKWEKFNSEKVASLAYARIQGKVALVTHFQNSSLMNEDKRCQPILFQSEGQEAADEVYFDMLLIPDDTGFDSF
ncbi:Protein MEI2-like 5 [Capsicum baccatum]|uniref:Protein MEI2-like 5 n=1 Tax=Capsicum baccatum TaxID=33114 RepID=A0A2G2VKE8_CAPBA|nr:Protein MEI2-like 5 [Capsicum baccatum]